MHVNHAIDTVARIYVPKAFPAALSRRAADVARLIPDYPYRLWGYDVTLKGELLEIPVRLYFPPSILSGADEISRHTSASLPRIHATSPPRSAESSATGHATTAQPILTSRLIRRTWGSCISANSK